MATKLKPELDPAAASLSVLSDGRIALGVGGGASAGGIAAMVGSSLEHLARSLAVAGRP